MFTLEHLKQYQSKTFSILIENVQYRNSISAGRKQTVKPVLSSVLKCGRFQNFWLSFDTCAPFHLAKRDTPHDVLTSNIGRKHYLALMIELDRHTLQQSLAQNLGIILFQIRLVQRWTHFKNCCHLCQKSGLNLATRWLFTSIMQYTNVIIGLKLSAIETNVTTVSCVQRIKIKSGLKLLLMETEDAMYT